MPTSTNLNPQYCKGDGRSQVVCDVREGKPLSGLERAQSVQDRESGMLLAQSGTWVASVNLSMTAGCIVLRARIPTCELDVGPIRGNEWYGRYFWSPARQIPILRLMGRQPTSCGHWVIDLCPKKTMIISRDGKCGLRTGTPRDVEGGTFHGNWKLEDVERQYGGRDMKEERATRRKRVRQVPSGRRERDGWKEKEGGGKVMYLVGT
ncbi:hypothetical protein LX32DRAFT_658343 [Colletotrichum zoysiae]|uniref:Uncharacterized protein n=1 Tax=Colletotrichum zoysiae TaxID=1216348 RepID=A0AAD9H5A9_9PEZI|nr:hypothetical protein LX32DRAFT_658343 [Colletotrichum zoysiae]